MNIPEEAFDKLKGYIKAKNNMNETIKKLLKAILELRRWYNGYELEEATTIDELKKLDGDISLEEVLRIFQTESGISSKDYEEFIEEYRKNLKGR
jgi:hypothetical protein